jgi:hypothetical protein
MKKTIQVDIPEYLTIDQYTSIINAGGTSLEKMVSTVSSLTDLTVDQVKELPIDVIKNISDDITELSFPKETFHAIVEFDNVLYGYAHMKQCSLGEYMELEKLCEDVTGNMHKIAAILYRPVTKNRFNSLSFAFRQGVKAVNNKVENPFDWYEIETYDSNKRKDRDEQFKDFPSHIFLGALSFFLGTANLYLTNILYSMGKLSRRTMERQNNDLLVSLSVSIGDGLQPYTIYLNPTSFQSRGINPLLN